MAHDFQVLLHEFQQQSEYEEIEAELKSKVNAAVEQLATMHPQQPVASQLRR